MSISFSASEPQLKHGPIAELCFPSRPDRKEDPIDAVTQLLIDQGWVAADDETWLRLCLEEVVLNAMYHGNEGDPDLNVHLRVYDEGSTWAIRVDDVGDGFTQEQVPENDSAEAMLREHGRGLLLMGEWLDSLTYYNGGCTVIMQRSKTKLQSDPESK